MPRISPKWFRNPKRLINSERGSAPVISAVSSRMARSALSGETHTTPSIGQKFAPNHFDHTEAHHFTCFDSMRLSPSGPTSLWNSSMTRIGRAATPPGAPGGLPATTNLGSSV